MLRQWLKSFIFTPPQKSWPQRLRAIQYAKEFLDESELENPNHDIPAIPDLFCDYVDMDLLYEVVMINMIYENKLNRNRVLPDKDGVIICSRTLQVVVHSKITNEHLLRTSAEQVAGLIAETMEQLKQTTNLSTIKELNGKIYELRSRLNNINTSIEKLEQEKILAPQIALAREWYKLKYLDNACPKIVRLKEIELRNSSLPDQLWQQLSTHLANEDKSFKARQTSIGLGDRRLRILIGEYPELEKIVHSAKTKLELINLKIPSLENFLFEPGVLPKTDSKEPPSKQVILNAIATQLKNLVFGHEQLLRQELSILRFKANNLTNPTMESIVAFRDEALKILRPLPKKFTRLLEENEPKFQKTKTKLDRILAPYVHQFDISEIDFNVQIMLKYIHEDALTFHIEQFVSAQEKLHTLSGQIQNTQDSLSGIINNTIHPEPIDGINAKDLKTLALSHYRSEIRRLKKEKAETLRRSIKIIKTSLNVEKISVDHETYDVLLRQQDELNAILDCLWNATKHISPCLTQACLETNLESNVIHKAMLRT